MAAGVAAGVYQIEHMAAVTFTRKAASELRGRFHLALEADSASGLRPASSGRGEPRRARRRAAASARARTSSASSPAPSTPSARACCASVPSSPACRPASPSWTKCRTWSCASAPGATSSPPRASAGDPDMVALLEAGVKPKDLDQAFAIICVQRRCRVPAGRRRVSGSEGRVEGAGEVLEGAPEAPALDDRPGDDRARCSRRCCSSAASLRVSQKRLDRPSLDCCRCWHTWDCESQITQNRWADDNGREEAVPGR